MLTNIEDAIGDENYSFLMAMGSAAEIQIHTDDAEDKKSWALLDRTMGPGNFANSIRLDQQTAWEIGDRIVIASTDFDLDQAEEFTITNVQQGGRTLTIDRNVTHKHYGDIKTYSSQGMTWDLDMRAEVALLSRDVKIQGDVAYNHNATLADQTDQFGGHIMIMNEAAIYISGVEFRYMGQAQKLGRYCIHWHKLRDVRGQYVKHCASSYSFNKGYTIHSTHNALLEENTVFESIGHSYYLEDGAEVGNRLVRNLAINARKPASEAEANSKFRF